MRARLEEVSAARSEVAVAEEARRSGVRAAERDAAQQVRVRVRVRVRVNPTPTPYPTPSPNPTPTPLALLLTLRS